MRAEAAGWTALAVVATFVVAVLYSAQGSAPAPSAPLPEAPAVVLPWVAEVAPSTVVAAMERGVPPSVEATADVVAAAWAPGLRLVEARRGETWEAHRALIEDATTGDARLYAIGDLLPHGSLLVAVSTAAVDVLVADMELVRLDEKGGLRSIHDFRTALEAQPLARAPELADAYVEGAAAAVQATLSEDPEVVQAAIDALIEAGEPAVELIIAEASSEAPVAAYPYRFPSGGERQGTPVVQGDVVIGVLEAVTGQTFGDVFRPDITRAERLEIAGKWRSWWGG
ncbi:MAG: hypothetical protein H6730_13355 [Deltaproteobacteria bacterium]|nr:hypothetical protein [Deltaproteobacteria bacterium]